MNGRKLNEPEMVLMECYRNLAQVVAERGDELAPFEHRNALKALAALWQIANGLDQEPGQLYHLGV